MCLSQEEGDLLCLSGGSDTESQHCDEGCGEWTERDDYRKVRRPVCVRVFVCSSVFTGPGEDTVLAPVVVHTQSYSTCTQTFTSHLRTQKWFTITAYKRKKKITSVCSLTNTHFRSQVWVVAFCGCNLETWWLLQVSPGIWHWPNLSYCFPFLFIYFGTAAINQRRLFSRFSFLFLSPLFSYGTQLSSLIYPQLCLCFTPY